MPPSLPHPPHLCDQQVLHQGGEPVQRHKRLLHKLVRVRLGVQVRLQVEPLHPVVLLQPGRAAHL